VNPKTPLNLDEISVTSDFNDLQISHFQYDARMDITSYTQDDEEYIVFASTTKSNQVMLLFYERDSGQQVYVHTLGLGNPVEVTDIVPARKEGLLILGKTWINGQYQRIILYNISSDQLKIKS
jgi:hypothetical protein